MSKFPIYSIMSDYLKISWAKFSKDVTNHSRMMTKVSSGPTLYLMSPYELTLHHRDRSSKLQALERGS